MKVRALDPAEYPRLKDIPDGFLPDPENSRVIVAEDENGNIVGRMMLIAVAHLEGPWIAPSRRSGSLLYRMEKQMIAEAREAGLKALLAFTQEDTNTSYLERLGWTRTNFTVLSKEI